MVRTTLKFLASGDIHMSNRLPYAKPSAKGRTDRLDEQLALLAQMREKAEEHNVNGVLLLGDIFDKSLVDAVTLTHTVEAIVKFKKPVYILPGNHDANNIKGGRFTVEAFGAMDLDHVMFIGDPEPLAFEDWLVMWPLPYMPVDATRATLASIREKMDKDKVNVLLMHNSIIGCTHIGWKCDDGLKASEVCSGFNWVLSGHFHDTQRFGKDRGMYLGAPMHHHFGDAGRQAGFWIFEFKSDGKREDTYIQSDMPRFYNYDRLEEPIEAVAGDFVRYRIRATHPDWEALRPKAKALINSLSMRGIRADYKHEPVYHHESRMGKAAKVEKAATLTMDEAVSRYVGLEGVVTGDLDRERLIRLGREALSTVRGGHGPA